MATNEINKQHPLPVQMTEQYSKWCRIVIICGARDSQNSTTQNNQNSLGVRWCATICMIDTPNNAGKNSGPIWKLLPRAKWKIGQIDLVNISHVAGPGQGEIRARAAFKFNTVQQFNEMIQWVADG